MTKKSVLMTSALMAVSLLAGCGGQHTHNWDEVVYQWSADHKSCTATRVCKDDKSHVETETKDAVYAVIKEAKCEEDGTGRYTVTFDNEALGVAHFDITLEQTGHKWGTPTYEWSEDGKSCTATVICGNDSTHKIVETVEGKFAELEAATEEADGKGKYTATFENEKFATQEREFVLESLPTLSKLAFTSNEDGTYSVKCINRDITGRVKIPSTYGDGEEEGLVTSLPEDAFFNAENITEVFIPSSVKTIGNYGFFSCTKITDIHFAENSVLESVGNYAFNSCHSLVSVTFPKSLKTLGESFYQLDNLESVVFEEGNELESIGYGCFRNCPKLKTIEFAETSKFKEIDHTFGNLDALEELDLPNSVESITTYSIDTCHSLKTLKLSKGLKTIQIYSIFDCPIDNFQFKGTVEEWNQIEKDDSWYLSVASNVVHCTDGDVAI